MWFVNVTECILEYSAQFIWNSSHVNKSAKNLAFCIGDGCCSQKFVYVWGSMSERKSTVCSHAVDKQSLHDCSFSEVCFFFDYSFSLIENHTDLMFQMVGNQIIDQYV